MNDENFEFQLTYRKIITIAWFITLFVSVIFAIVGLIFNRDGYWYSWVLSYLLGAMTNFFAFNLLKNNVANITGDTKNVITGTYSNYLIRFLIYAGLLFIAFNNDKLNPYLVAAGFINIRIAIYIYSYLYKK